MANVTEYEDQIEQYRIVTIPLHHPPDRKEKNFRTKSNQIQNQFQYPDVVEVWLEKDAVVVHRRTYGCNQQ